MNLDYFILIDRIHARLKKFMRVGLTVPVMRVERLIRVNVEVLALGHVVLNIGEDLRQGKQV